MVKMYSLAAGAVADSSFLCFRCCLDVSQPVHDLLVNQRTVLGLATEGHIVVSDHMLISILSMLVEALEMSDAEAVDALAPWNSDLKPDDLLSSLHLMCNKVKFILNPVLPFRHLFWGLTRLQLCELVVKCLLRLKPGLAHLDRQLVTVGEPLPETFLPCFDLKMFISFVVQLLVVLHKVYNILLI